MTSKKNIAVVGAGVTGLAAVRKLGRAKNVRVKLFDMDERVGGVLSTERSDGFLIEHSADMFVTDPNWAVQFFQEIGLENEFVAPNKTNRFSSIVRDGHLVRTPAGFSLLAPNQLRSVLMSSLLSPWGKLRFLLEYFHRRRNEHRDESLKSFATRHFGKETFERLVQPLVAGIYSADAARLSIHATLDRFVKMEREHGSLIKAARYATRQRVDEQESSGARYGMFLSPKHGFGSLVAAIERSSTDVDVKLKTAVERITIGLNRFSLSYRNKTENFDGVVLATSAKVSAGLLANVDDGLDDLLRQVRFGSLIVVAITCRDSNFRLQPPQGFGFVVPEIERRKIIACSFSSNKFSNRAPGGHHLMRVFIGGSTIESARTMSDRELQRLVDQELADLIGFRSDDQVSYRFLRWLDCMPQYEVGHLARMESIKEKVKSIKGLELAGSSYFGVGIPACIHSGIKAAERLCT